MKLKYLIFDEEVRSDVDVLIVGLIFLCAIFACGNCYVGAGCWNVTKAISLANVTFDNENICY